MPSVQYGKRLIRYKILEKPGLSSHYISVDRIEGVVLKGNSVSKEKADQLILKKAKWILDKQALVKTISDEKIMTGSRLPYFGKTYYVELITDPKTKTPTITFNYSRFKIRVNNYSQITATLENFYKEKAAEKITPRIKKIAHKSKLQYTALSYRRMRKRWGSCSTENQIIINVQAAKLPYSLIDYLIIHELCHTKVKNHSKSFWALLSKHEPKWRELDERISSLKF
jgi:predicted metal-dependent hydrolase